MSVTKQEKKEYLRRLDSRKYNTGTVLSVFVLSNVSVLLISLLYNFFFIQSPESFSCVFYEKCGIYCPGCGGSRSLNMLLNLRLFKSFLIYPPILITVVFIIDIDIRCIISLVKKKYSPIFSFRGIYMTIIPISVMLLFFARLISLSLGFDMVEFAMSL